MNSTWTVGSGHGPCARARARSRWFGKSSARSQNSKRIFKNSLFCTKKAHGHATFLQSRRGNRPPTLPAHQAKATDGKQRPTHRPKRLDTFSRRTFQSLRLNFLSLRLKFLSLRLKIKGVRRTEKDPPREAANAFCTKNQRFPYGRLRQCVAFSYICSPQEATAPLLFLLSAIPTLRTKA